MIKTITMKNFGLLFLFFLIANQSIAQALDEELGFIYVKADYLLETDRYEEAISEFNKIVNQDPAYKDVLYKRASAKYALAAYRGVKKDLLLSFEHVGIKDESLLLFGEAQEALGDAGASNTLKTASKLYPDHRKTKKYKDEEVHEEKESEEVSQEDKLKEDVKKIEDKLSSILDDLLPDDKKAKNGDNPENDSEVNEEERSETQREKVEVYIPDNSINEIYIDEDLTLEIKNGLGGRKILQQPSILILSETSGNVAIDICVNRNGKVTSSEYNSNDSSLSTQSLISLAVRKSKEFWFVKSDRKETCGTIIFKISGRA